MSERAMSYGEIADALEAERDLGISLGTLDKAIEILREAEKTACFPERLYEDSDN
jgi:hypothetical protein